MFVDIKIKIIENRYYKYNIGMDVYIYDNDG